MTGTLQAAEGERKTLRLSRIYPEVCPILPASETPSRTGEISSPQSARAFCSHLPLQCRKLTPIWSPSDHNTGRRFSLQPIAVRAIPIGIGIVNPPNHPKRRLVYGKCRYGAVYALSFICSDSAPEGHFRTCSAISFFGAPLTFTHGRFLGSKTEGRPWKQMAEWIHLCGSHFTTKSSIA